MRKNIISSVTILILGLIIFILLPSESVFADDPQSVVELSPMHQKVILAPGESQSFSLKITNPNKTQNDLHYSASVGSFNYNSDDSIDTNSVTNYNQIMNWIQLDSDGGIVKPNETDTFTFTITVPNDAPAGGQYATILIRDDTSKYVSGKSNVNIESTVQVASIIYAEIAGETIDTGEIIENNIPSISFSNQLNATSLVKNTGNVHTNAKYTFQVWPLFSSEEVCTNEENVDESLIMPGAEHYYTQTCTVPPIGIFRARQIVKIFGEESTIEKTIFVCPIWLLFIIIFAIIVLITWLVLRARSRKKSSRESKREEA